MWLGFASVEVAPSPKFQVLPVSLTEVSVNLTVRGARPNEGTAVKLAFGITDAAVTDIVLLVASVPSALLAVRLAVNVPAVAYVCSGF